MDIQSAPESGSLTKYIVNHVYNQSSKGVFQTIM
jgi:hypothetical protein